MPEISLVTHVHTIASLREAKRYGVPVVLLIRKPVDTVISSCLKYGREPDDHVSISNFFYDYYHYHEFVLNSMEVSAIYRFEDTTQKTVLFLKSFANSMEYDLGGVDLDSEVKRVDEIFLAREHSKDPLGSSLPNVARRSRKAEYKRSVESNPERARAEAVYSSLCLNAERLGL